MLLRIYLSQDAKQGNVHLPDIKSRMNSTSNLLELQTEPTRKKILKLEKQSIIFKNMLLVVQYAKLSSYLKHENKNERFDIWQKKELVLSE